MNSSRPTSRVGRPDRTSKVVAKLCDRSPCDALLDALGNYAFGSPDGYYLVVLQNGRELEPLIGYCPFCGTRLEEVPQVVLEKFTRPRRRKRRQVAMS